MPRVLLVVDDHGLHAALITETDNPAPAELRAERMARNIGGVVAEVRVTYDGRKGRRRG